MVPNVPRPNEGITVFLNLWERIMNIKVPTYLPTLQKKN